MTRTSRGTALLLVIMFTVSGATGAGAVVNPDRSVSAHEAEWTALIETFEDGERFVTCSGSLISPNIVLTAAHCVYALSSNSTVVRFGAEGDRASVTRRIAGVVYHGKYSRQETLYEFDDAGELVRETPGDVRPGENSYDADIAIIALSAPVGSIRPVDLARPSYRAVPGWRVYGYGATGPGGDEAPMRVLTAAQIDMTHQIRHELVGPHNRVLGAGAPGSGTCYGDSGGPLVDGAGVLIGLTSFGLDEVCNTDLATVFTKVSAFYDWISRATRLVGKSLRADPTGRSWRAGRSVTLFALE